MQPRHKILDPSSKIPDPKITGWRERGSVFGTRCLLAVGCLVFGVCSALAFPPAPHHVLFGMVRNQWGDPINVAGAEVFLETTNAAGLKATLYPGVEPDANYRLLVPMDAGISPDVYKSTALKPSGQFRLRVKIGQTTYLPIEMAGDLSRIGQPAQSTRLDLTLGEDTDGDGLPDAWERALIAALGRTLTLADIRPNDDSDGDGISNLNEYRAGTYAFDPNDGFELALVGVNQAASTMEFLALRGRNYTIESSPDLRQWTPVQFRIATEGPSAPLRANYLANDVRLLRVEVPFQLGGETNRYFKARVQ